MSLVEHTHEQEMPQELWIPMANIVGEMLSPRGVALSEERWEFTRRFFEALPDTKMKLRGSTLIYVLLHRQGIQRRALFSSVVPYLLHDFSAEDMRTSTMTLSNLRDFSDIDITLPEISPDEFGKIAERYEESLSHNLMFHRGYMPKEDNGIHVYDSQFMLPDITHPGRFSPTTIIVEKGKVAEGIPYIDTAVLTKGSRIKVFLSAGKTENTKVQDTRLDPEYSLSWDSAAIGDIVRGFAPNFEHMIQSRISETTLLQRGIFYPEHLGAENREMWVHINGEALRALQRPMEVGKRFAELPAIEQFYLALRAAQRGTYAEENVGLAMSEYNSETPAISESTRQIFCRIDQKKFYKHLRMEMTVQRSVLPMKPCNIFYQGFFTLGNFLNTLLL